jgi:hypothetical protein
LISAPSGALQQRARLGVGRLAEILVPDPERLQWPGGLHARDSSSFRTSRALYVDIGKGLVD